MTSMSFLNFKLFSLIVNIFRIANYLFILLSSYYARAILYLIRAQSNYSNRSHSEGGSNMREKIGTLLFRQ